MRTTKSFFAKLYELVFVWRLKREISRRIIPHIHKQKDCGYPFVTEQELRKTSVGRNLDAKLLVEIIQQEAEQMDTERGDAFRYIAYRDLNEQMLLYVRFARK